MMSSEEETGDCFGLYGDKLLSKKAKRTRQRVDAGEPRNSYSSIPNFSSRPSFLSGGLYGAIFSSSQQQQHFGLFAPGFAPAKMLNELLGRQVKQASDANNLSPDSMMTMDQASADVPIKFECNTPVIRRSGLEDSAAESAELAAHHMLRDILQGRKHELMALEHELRASGPDNNNTIPNNNNNNEIKSEEVEAAVAMQECLAEAGVGSQQQAELMEEALTGMESKSLPSPKGDQEPSSPARPEDAKRARVEHIVSGMRASPVPQSAPPHPQVNGCKKRKLYQPQQHDAGLGLADDDDDDEPEPLRQKRVEKDALKSQLRTMQEQLAEMQQKYVQLCTRMEQESECQEVEEVTSDIEQDISDQRSLKSAPPSPPIREQPSSVPPPTNPPPPQMISQAVSKMISAAKMHPGVPPPPQHMMHSGAFNGMSGLMHPSEAAPGTHPGLSNAAAMYLGVSHKLFLEQEARFAKEAAERHHHMQQAQQEQAQQAAAAAAAAQQSAQQSAQQMNTSQNNQQTSSQQQSPQHSKELAERLQMLRQPTISGSELEGLADVLKTEITASLSNLIDTIVTRFMHQRRFLGKHSETAAAEQLNKDLMMASQLLDRKSPRMKVMSSNQVTSQGASQPPQGSQQQPPQGPPISSAGPMPPRMNGTSFPQQMSSMQLQHMAAQATGDSKLGMPEHARFQAPKPPPGMNSVAAAALYGLGPQHNPFCVPPDSRENPEQNEALSLVVAPKKKRHKVTDTRITPRTVSRILAQDGIGLSSPSGGSVEGSRGINDCPSPRPYHPPPPMLPVSLPTSVAIPNPSLHESQVFSPYSPFFTGPGGHHHGHHIVPGPAGASPPGLGKLERDSPPLPHPPTLLHPALLAAAQHGASPDYGGHMRASSGGLKMDSGDHNSDCNSADIGYDGIQPTISFSDQAVYSSTLTPMHLRKAKLMFFWVRYPSSAVLKMYFPDIKFNKNNTAQLVKWFSNFREFYYIQMEKYARQAVSEGVKNAEDLHVGADSEIYRVLNLHYNRNNHIEVWGPQVPSNFRFVVEQTLREFFKAIQGGKDSEQSWKKSIYKIISRLDDPVPEYFKSPNFLEQLE